MAIAQTTWGDLNINVTDFQGSGGLDINLVKLVPHPVEQPVSEKMMILFGEQVTTLSNKNIVIDSDVLIFKGDNENIKYTRNVDYHIDYANGTINRIASGSIPDGVNTYLSYRYYDLSADVVKIPGVLNVNTYTFEGYATINDFAKLQQDQINQVKKSLILPDGNTVQAYIQLIPIWSMQIGDDTKTFTITFVEA